MSASRVTIGVPVFNGEAFLAEALDSVLAQDHGDLEILIWDNASTDATGDIAQDFARQDQRITYHRNERNVGGAVNSNLLLEAATAPYFKWVYYDDLMDSSTITRCLEVLDAAGDDVVAAYPRAKLIDTEGRVVGEHDDADLDLAGQDPADRVAKLLGRVVTQVQFGVMRTDVVRKAGGVSVDVAGELALPLALALRGKLVLVPEQLLMIRQHEDRHGGDRQSEAAWVNPDRPHAAFPYSRSTPLFVQTIRNAPLTSRERTDCLRALFWHWTRPGWKTIVGDVVRLPQDAGWVKR